ADDAEKGIKGVCQNADIVDFKITNRYFVKNEKEEGGGHWDDFSSDSFVVSAIDRVNSLWGTTDEIDVMNYSYSGYGKYYQENSSGNTPPVCDQFNDNILWAVKSYPGTFVWSAGNDHQVLMDKDYRYCPNLISVGSYGQDGHVSPFSNYGEAVSIFAPGEDIVSTVRNNRYESWDGTSMAAPFVAGTAALIYHAFPGISSHLVKEAITESVNWEQAPRDAFYYDYDDEGNEIQHTGDSGSLEYIKKLNVEAALDKAKELYEESLKDDNPLRMEMLNCRNDTWTVLIRNQSKNFFEVKYSEKSMSIDDARNYRPDSSAKTITLGSLESEIVTISNKSNNYACAASLYRVIGKNAKRFTSYLYRNFWDTGSQEHYPLFTEDRTENKVTDYIAKSDLVALKFKVLDWRVNWFVKDWKIEIINGIEKTVNVAYNACMCFYNDGKDWKNLRDVKSLALGSKATSSAFWINANGTADSIAISVLYRDEKDTRKRLVTVANEIRGKGVYPGDSYTINA
ncbi:MAG: S8 family serine peptidase, partial [Bacilli bacterium]|nr:S8 family serine peptidase [Bacilli bacterium]